MPEGRCAAWRLLSRSFLDHVIHVHPYTWSRTSPTHVVTLYPFSYQRAYCQFIPQLLIPWQKESFWSPEETKKQLGLWHCPVVSREAPQPGFHTCTMWLPHGFAFQVPQGFVGSVLSSSSLLWASLTCTVRQKALWCWSVETSCLQLCGFQIVQPVVSNICLLFRSKRSI
jgi:hypothetical protein